MTGELEGRTVIVTGASRGIGKALAIGLATRGAAVVCAARTVADDPGGLPGTIHATAAATSSHGPRGAGPWLPAGPESAVAAGAPGATAPRRAGGAGLARGDPPD